MISISVIIPGYNTPNAWWERCVRSVLLALPVDGEVICVDDGSPSRPQVDVDDSRIVWMYLDKNVGQAAARNRALAMAQGEYVTFVDSDDVVYDEVYHRCLEAAKNDGTDIVVYGVRVEWCQEKLYKTDVLPRQKVGVLSNAKIIELYDHCLFEYPVNKLYRRSFLESYKIRFEEGVCPGEDTIFNLTCLLYAPKWSIVEYVGYVYYRVDGTSLSRYLPRYVESEKTKAESWRKIMDCPMGIWSEKRAVDIAWTNMWRRNSPIGFVKRWRFARQHQLSFWRMAVRLFLRRYCYVTSLRRMRIKMKYPYAKELI